MDKLSLKVLRFISTKKDRVTRKLIIEKCGEGTQKSLTYLENDGFIQSGRIPIGMGPDLKPVFRSDGKFSITSKGLEYLEARPGHVFDRWLTRFCAIWGAITGTAAIIAEIWLHFQ